jgi:hypothetical protein
MYSIRDVSAALDGHLVTLPNAPQIAWPNVPFTAPAETYLRVNNLPANGELYTFNYAQDVPGVYQVTVVSETSQGAGEAENQADAVMSHFRVTKIGDVTIESINVAPAVVTEDTFEIPVSINWRVID